MSGLKNFQKLLTHDQRLINDGSEHTIVGNTLAKFANSCMLRHIYKKDGTILELRTKNRDP